MIQASKKNHNFTPAAVYENPDLQKDQIYLENKGKSGIYRWKNLLNGKSYIGSSVDLYNRLRNYYSSIKKHMETVLKISRSAIYSSLRKYGISMFNSFAGNTCILWTFRMYWTRAILDQFHKTFIQYLANCWILIRL
jgi:hypothetical protein